MKQTNDYLLEAIHAFENDDKDEYEESIVLAAIWLGKTQESLSYLRSQAQDNLFFDSSVLYPLDTHLSGIIKSINAEKSNDSLDVNHLTFIQKNINWLLSNHKNTLFKALKDSDSENVDDLLNQWDRYRLRDNRDRCIVPSQHEINQYFFMSIL
ncbi:hypothetical protein [Pontibacillus marinus]|nr:hypothetical protein [Pontibacillus marinus]